MTDTSFYAKLRTLRGALSEVISDRERVPAPAFGDLFAKLDDAQAVVAAFLHLDVAGEALDGQEDNIKVTLPPLIYSLAYWNLKHPHGGAGWTHLSYHATRIAAEKRIDHLRFHTVTAHWREMQFRVGPVVTGLDTFTPEEAIAAGQDLESEVRDD